MGKRRDNREPSGRERPPKIVIELDPSLKLVIEPMRSGDMKLSVKAANRKSSCARARTRIL